jgi:hypothetical protein
LGQFLKLTGKIPAKCRKQAVTQDLSGEIPAN